MHISLPAKRRGVSFLRILKIFQGSRSSPACAMICPANMSIDLAPQTQRFKRPFTLAPRQMRFTVSSRKRLVPREPISSESLAADMRGRGYADNSWHSPARSGALGVAPSTGSPQSTCGKLASFRGLFRHDPPSTELVEEIFLRH